MRKFYLKQLVKLGYLVIENDDTDSKCGNKELSLLLKSFASLGYTLDESGIEKISKFSNEKLGSFYHANYIRISEITGVNKKHKIFYPNFPDMADISDEEFDVRAILHYLTVSKNNMGFMNQDIEFKERLKVHNENKEVLHFIDEESAYKILFSTFINLFEGKVAIPHHYEEFVVLMLKDFNKEIQISEIPFKENLAFYINCILIANNNKPLEEVLTAEKLHFIKTPTDLLRVYSVLSKQGYALKHNVNFVSLKRCIRRLFLSILDDMALNNPYMIDDLAKHEFLWKRAFEKLHVSEYSSKYANIVKLASQLRNDEYQTYCSKLEASKNNQVELIKLLKIKPGEFARRLDMVLRNPLFDCDYTLSAFKEVASNISTTVLLQLWKFFKNRNLYKTRIFSIQKEYGSYAKEIEDNRNIIDKEIIDKILQLIEDTLSDIYRNYAPLGNVYIDESMKQYCLPINSRNASSQRKTLTFGTRIKIVDEEKKFLRFFTHFKNFKGKNGRVDIDLSIEFFNENFKEVESLSWHNMSGGRRFNSFHSGDITSAPNGASEFVDLDYKEARKFARYAVVTNCVYTGQSFSKIPECFSGVMFMTEACKKGVNYNPEFIKYMFDLTQKCQNENIAFALDLETLELIWIDAPISNAYSCVVASEDYGIRIALMNALKSHMSFYDFIMLHSKRFTIVENKENADVIISDSDDATLKPFDVEKISARWL